MAARETHSRIELSKAIKHVSLKTFREKKMYDSSSKEKKKYKSIFVDPGKDVLQAAYPNAGGSKEFSQFEKAIEEMYYSGSRDWTSGHYEKKHFEEHYLRTKAKLQNRGEILYGKLPRMPENMMLKGKIPPSIYAHWGRHDLSEEHYSGLYLPNNFIY